MSSRRKPGSIGGCGKRRGEGFARGDAEARRREEEQIFAREDAKTRRGKKWLLALRAKLFFAPKAQSIFFLRVFA